MDVTSIEPARGESISPLTIHLKFNFVFNFIFSLSTFTSTDKLEAAARRKVKVQNIWELQYVKIGEPSNSLHIIASSSITKQQLQNAGFSFSDDGSSGHRTIGIAEGHSFTFQELLDKLNNLPWIPPKKPVETQATPGASSSSSSRKRRQPVSGTRPASPKRLTSINDSKKGLRKVRRTI